MESKCAGHININYDEDCYVCDKCSVVKCIECEPSCGGCDNCIGCCVCRVCDSCGDKDPNATTADCPCHTTLCEECSNTCRGCLRVSCDEEHKLCRECGDCDQCCECVECSVCGENTYPTNVGDCECDYVCNDCSFACDSVECKGAVHTCETHANKCKECGLCDGCCDHCSDGCSRNDPAESKDECIVCKRKVEMCFSSQVHSGGIKVGSQSCYFCFLWCDGCTGLVPKASIKTEPNKITRVCDYWYDTIEGCPKCSPHLSDDITTLVTNIPDLTDMITSYLRIATPSSDPRQQPKKPRKKQCIH